MSNPFRDALKDAYEDGKYGHTWDRDVDQLDKYWAVIEAAKAWSTTASADDPNGDCDEALAYAVHALLAAEGEK
jgi:hypothetical protein